MIDNYSWITVLPEIVLLALACVIALVDLFVKGQNRTLTYILTLLTLAVVAVMQAAYGVSGLNQYGFSSQVVSDQMGNWLKCFAALSVLVTLVYARPYAAHRDMMRGGELFTLALFGLLGMFIMISGNNFLVIYMGLELLALSSYALVALRRDDTMATEAAMKYFVLGAMASGFLLYGLSMMYGATGSLNLNEVALDRFATRSWFSVSSLSSPVWHSNSVRCRSTCGFRTSTRARQPQSHCCWQPPPSWQRLRSSSGCWSRVCCHWHSTGSRCWRCWPLGR